MGDPKKPKKKYSTPSHPWNKVRIDEEKVLIEQYGLKNKTEIWKANSKVRVFAEQAKKLIRDRRTEQSKRETKNFLAKLVKIGLLHDDCKLEDVLELSITDVLNRRLQTIVYKKGLAITVKQARQLTTHGHIAINNRKITIPSYILTVEEESLVKYLENSSFNGEDHPEIVKMRKTEKKEEVVGEPIVEEEVKSNEQ